MFRRDIMIMIKLFEEYNDQNDQVYYEILDDDEFYDYGDDRFIKFSDSEFNKITKLVKFTTKNKLYIENKDVFPLNYHNVIEIYSLKSNAIIDINIWKLKDEWYIIKFGPYFFKCDQFEGLSQCLMECVGENNDPGSTPLFK